MAFFCCFWLLSWFAKSPVIPPTLYSNDLQQTFFLWKKTFFDRKPLVRSWIRNAQNHIAYNVYYVVLKIKQNIKWNTRRYSDLITIVKEYSLFSSDLIFFSWKNETLSLYLIILPTIMIFEKQKQKQKSDSHRLILNTRMRILRLKSTNFMDKILKISKNNGP